MIGHQGNLLQHALQDGRFAQFLIGEPPYYFEAKTDNPEPQNVQQAFDLQVVRYWSLLREPGFPEAFVKTLAELLDTYPDRNKAIYVVNTWVYTYCAAIQRKLREVPLGIYCELFEVDMHPVTDRLRQELSRSRQQLMIDTRWAGATWNSNTGLWGPIVRTAVVVRDRLSGPDYVPRLR